MTFLPYQELTAHPELPVTPEACAKALHLIAPSGEVLRAGRAMLRILAVIGWPRSAALLALPPFIWGVEIGYRLVANNRGTIAARMKKRG